MGKLFSKVKPKVPTDVGTYTAPTLAEMGVSPGYETARTNILEGLMPEPSNEYNLLRHMVQGGEESAGSYLSQSTLSNETNWMDLIRRMKGIR